jgi:Uma2 family endonuclease
MLELPIRPITVHEYQRMADVGIIDPSERVELLDGMLVTMPPTGDGHFAAHNFGLEWLILRLAPKYLVAGAFSFPLGDSSEPNPDIGIFRREITKKKKAQWTANDIIAFIEISDSSLGRDTVVKQRIYARANVPEYLVVDVNRRCIIQYQSPAGDGYLKVKEHRAPESLTLAGIPEMPLEVAAFFPED